MTSTTLTSASGYNVKNIIFSKPEVGNIPGGNLTFKRIRIGTRNPDGTTGDLILSTSELFSFGIQENTDMATGKVNGHVMPLCLWSKNGATDEGSPGPRSDGNYYGYILDHDGNKITARCLLS